MPPDGGMDRRGPRIKRGPLTILAYSSKKKRRNVWSYGIRDGRKTTAEEIV